MPTTVVSGLPGHGKTLYTLSTLLKEFKGRRIVVFGVPDIDHSALGTEPLEDPELWYDEPAGTVIVIDEAQKIFPVRGQGKPIPVKCSEFETHRHGGLDVVLITQDGTLLDAHVRKFIDHHIHLYRLFGSETSTVYKYSPFQPKPLAKSSQRGALAVETWMYPKKFYGAYKSADAHTIKRKIPTKLIVVSCLMAVAVGYIGWAVYYFASGNLMDDEPQADQTSFTAASTESAKKANTPDSKVSIAYTPEEYLKLMTPVIEGVPHSAPFYQSAYTAADFPRPNCIIIGDRDTSVQCKCFTQQMTTYETTYEMCRYYAIEGYFDPTIARAEQSSGSGEPASLPAAAPAIAQTGEVTSPRSSAGRLPSNPDRSVQVLPAANKVTRKPSYYGYGDSGQG
jgi:hypothetical protein